MLENKAETYYIENTKQKDNIYQYWRILIISSYTSDYIGTTSVQFYGVKINENNNPEYKYENRKDKEILKMCSEELKDVLVKTDIYLNLSDLYSESFFDKISKSENGKKQFLKMNEDSISALFDYDTEQLLKQKLDVALVPNLSSNANVICSSQYNASNYAAYRAFDNTNNYWCTVSEQVSDAYIGYNMGEMKKVYFASFYNECPGYNYRAKEIKLQCSNDGTNWIDASDVLTLENKTKRCYVENTKQKNNEYQYWRILIISSYTSDYVGSSSVQFYGW